MTSLLGTFVGGVGSIVGGVAGAVGVVGGVAGVVVGVAGAAVGGVSGGVVSIGRYIVGAEGDERPCYDPYVEDSKTIYEQKSRVDQILHFFETDHDRYVGYFKDLKKVESLRVAYYNCVSAIEFQNETLAQLVDEVLELRMQLRTGHFEGVPEQAAVGFGSRARLAEESARKEVCVKLAHAKLDVGERRSKRRAKEKERRALADEVSPLISEAKLDRLLEEQVAEKRTAEDVTSSWRDSDGPSKVAPGAPTRGSGAEREEESEVRSTQMEKNQSSAGLSRRKYKHYSDAELTALLREKDD